MFEVIELGGMKTVATKAACNHVYVVDVSGSMYYDLPKIRQHLKNTISLVAKPDDTFSVIWFSGRSQCGVVFENVLVSDTSTISMMHDSIDRFIKPVGLTGFVDPIKKALQLNLDKSKLNNFIMMTDGSDNQSKRDDILVEAAKLSTMYQSVSFIEYGYYADRDLLSKMANAVNGVHIFAEGIDKYETIMEDVVRGVPRVSNIEVSVNKRAKHCIFIYNGQVRIVDVVDGKASVPEDVERVHSIVPSDVARVQLSEDHLYLVLCYAAKTVNSELVWKCLQALGDVKLVEEYQNAFTKQELSIFEESVTKAVFDPSLRFLEGKDLTIVPAKDVPTVIDLLSRLSKVDSFVVTDSEYWSYNRIGRSSTTEEALPRFIPSPMSKVSLKGLVFNANRPNVSISTTLKGVVALPKNEFGLDKVPSHITRSYTVVKDGIRNMDQLPVVFPESAKADVENFKHTVVQEDDGLCYWVFDLTKIPVINRAMVEGVSLDKFVKIVEDLEPAKASLKVLTQLIKDQGGSEGKILGLIEKYGEAAAKWLSDIGVRDYGFGAVGTKSSEATDEYDSIQVEYKIKGLSSLPSLDAVSKKVAEGKKLNLGDVLINSAVAAYENADKESLEELKKNLTEVKRELERLLANEIYTLVLGRQWYGEEEVVETEVNLYGNKAPMTIEKVRKSVKV